MKTKIKDPWNPTHEEISAWAFSGEYQPEQDWHLAVAREDNAELIAQLASDDKCPNQRFFLACMYLLVGDAVRSKYQVRSKEFIDQFVDRWKGSSSGKVATWAERSRSLIENPAEFKYEDWCGWGFVSRDASAQ